APTADGPQRKPESKARTDRFGDALPPGARLRLGTVRLRHGGQHGGLVTFTADGKTLVSAHGDGVVHFWEAAAGKERSSLGTGLLCSRGGPAALSRGGEFVALPVGNALSVWDVAAGKELHRNLSHGTFTTPCLAFAPDGRRAATGSSDGIRVWE